MNDEVRCLNLKYGRACVSKMDIVGVGDDVYSALFTMVLMIAMHFLFVCLMRFFWIHMSNNERVYVSADV